MAKQETITVYDCPQCGEQRQRGGPTGSVVTYSDDELDMAASRGRAAQAELDRRRLWDEKHASALYAWQVDDK